MMKRATFGNCVGGSTENQRHAWETVLEPQVTSGAKRGTQATGAVLAANDSRPVWSIFAVVVCELKESADQQLFNSIHGSFPAGFADIFPGIWFDSGGFVTTLGAVAAVVLRHFCVGFL